MSQNPTSIINYSLAVRRRIKVKAQSGSYSYLALGVTSVVWGTTWVASKIGVQGIHPLFFSGIRQLSGGTLFLLFFIITGKFVFPSKRDWPRLIMMAFLLFVASNGLTTWGIKYISSGLGSILGAIFPLIIAIIEWSGGSATKPGKLGITGLLLGLAGVAIIFYEHIPSFADSKFTLGILLSLAASITWAIATVATARTTISLNRYYALGWQMFLAGVILLLISYVSGFSMPLTEIGIHTWQSLGYMVVFGSILAFGSLVYTLQHLPVTIAALYAYFNPMVAVVCGYLVLGEPISVYLLAGAIVTLAGVFLVNVEFRKKQHADMEAEEEESETIA